MIPYEIESRRRYDHRQLRNKIERFENHMCRGETQKTPDAPRVPDDPVDQTAKAVAE